MFRVVAGFRRVQGLGFIRFSRTKGLAGLIGVYP